MKLTTVPTAGVITEVEMNSTAYILEKDGEYFVFESEKSACEYLGVVKCSVSSAFIHNAKCKGYTVIRAKSEKDIYKDDRLWKIWEGMHERCEYEKHPHFKSYGGRGIAVCEEWNEYLPFAKWSMKNGYRHDLTIDRVDNDGDYEPSNCRWVSVKEQQNNRRNNHIIEYKGVKYTLTQLAEKIGIGKTTLRERLKAGWSVEEAVEKPIRSRTKGYRPSGAKMEEEYE